jgi:hypothetical protein
MAVTAESELSTLTVMVYSAEELSTAVMVYLMEPVKSRASPETGLTLTPVWEIVGVRFLRFVPKGTVTVMFVPLIVLFTGGETKLKPVISLSELRSAVGLSQAVKNRAVRTQRQKRTPRGLDPSLAIEGGRGITKSDGEAAGREPGDIRLRLKPRVLPEELFMFFLLICVPRLSKRT